MSPNLLDDKYLPPQNISGASLQNGFAAFFIISWNQMRGKKQQDRKDKLYQCSLSALIQVCWNTKISNWFKISIVLWDSSFKASLISEASAHRAYREYFVSSNGVNKVFLNQPSVEKYIPNDRLYSLTPTHTLRALSPMLLYLCLPFIFILRAVYLSSQAANGLAVTQCLGLVTV